MATITKSNTKGKTPRRPSPSPAPGFNFGLPPQSPQPGFEINLPPIPQLPGGAAGPVGPSSPWAMFGQQAPAPPIDFASLFSSMRNDPVGDANKSYIPGAVDSPTNPFTNGFFGANSASTLSPEAGMATQGRSGMNQWAQLGGVPGVDPAKLQNIMGQMTPIPQPGALPNSEASDPFFNRRMGQGGYPAPQGGIPIADQLKLIQLLYGGASPAPRM